jgi:polysaccharide export outer membrane protein
MSYEAVESIAVHSGGIPRNVNRICFNVLALGCALGKTHISKSLVEDAGSDVGLRLLAMQDLPNGAIYPRWSKAPDSAQQPTPDTQRAHRPSGGPPFVTPCREIHAQAPAQPELAQPVSALPIAESASQGLHRASARSVLRAGQWVFGWIRKTSTVRRTFLLLALEITACTALLPGQATNTSVRIASDESVTPQFQPRTPRYQIRPADIIEISFYPSAELNQTLSVQPDGYIALREAGDLYVAGKTVPELKEAVISAYRKILHEPVITIVLKEFEKPHFTVGGQVGRPGKYELRADTTASEGIAIAGGLTERAKHSQVLLFRRISKEWVEAKELDLKAVYSGKWREDIQLRPGDMLFVPQNKISKLKQFLPAWTVGTYLPPAAF